MQKSLLLENGHPLKRFEPDLVSHPIRGLKDSNVDYRRPPSEQ